MKYYDSDVVVVGAGIMSAFSALRLAQRKRAVFLLDKGEIGRESTGRCGGGVRQQYRDPAELPLAMQAVSIWAGLGKELGEPLKYRRHGSLKLLQNDEELEEAQVRVARERESGLDVDLLTPAEVVDCAPSIGPDTDLTGGTLAGLDAAYSLGRISKNRFAPLIQPLLNSKKRAARYSQKLEQIYTPRDALYQTITPETIICRCEGVTAGEIWKQMEKGRLDLTSLKPARLGMGPCQGRGCESIAAELLRLHGVDSHMIEPLGLRPPLIPLPISVFEKKDDEVCG